MNRQTWLCFSLLISALLAGACEKLPPEQEHFAKGYAAYNKGDFITAVLYLKPLVEAENPAAELLMAKMYANGEGVPVDIGKSEYLRNSATLAIFKKRNITPGEMNPMGTSLASISKRLDYYMDASEGKEAPVKDLSEIVQSLGVGSMAELQSRDPDSGENTSDQSAAATGATSPDINVDLPSEITKESSEVAAEIRDSVRSPAPTDDSSDLPVAMPPKESSRGNDQITLSILRQSAENGDPMAMEFLSAAYAHGFYGLKPNKERYSFWAAQARKVQQRAPLQEDSQKKIPVLQLGLVLVIGMGLIGGGIWLWRAQISR
jgi:TPR repeat protein